MDLEDMPDVVIALVTRVLEHRALGLQHRNLHAPRALPIRRIINGELVAHRVGINPRKAFNHAERRTRSAEPGLAREVGRLDHERVSLPASA